jgi:hypothetical protein
VSSVRFDKYNVTITIPYCVEAPKEVEEEKDFFSK